MSTTAESSLVALPLLTPGTESPPAQTTEQVTPPEAKLNIYRFSVDQYHRIGEAGILRPDHGVELLEGCVVRKMTRNPPHEYVIQKLDDMIAALLPKGWRRKLQSPITLADSEPEPDLVIFRGDLNLFRNRHPGPADIGLVIEVADSSLPLDSKLKSRMYARAGLLVYWIVNLPDRRVEVYSQPSVSEPASYGDARVFQEADKVPLTLDGTHLADLAVADILP